MADPCKDTPGQETSWIVYGLCQGVRLVPGSQPVNLLYNYYVPLSDKCALEFLEIASKP